jgi:phage gp36-like protein
MGQYLVIADLEARFNSTAEVAYLTGTESTGVPDTARENEAIVAGEGDIDSRIGRMYVTGATLMSSASAAALAVVKAYATDCAEYRLRMNLGQAASDDKTKMYDRALKWAEMVGTGTFVLTGATTVASSLGRSPGAVWSTHDRELPDDTARNVSRATAGAI